MRKLCGFFAALLLACAAAADTRPLDGGWQLLPDKDASLTASTAPAAKGWRDVRVGLSWNAQFDDMRDYTGVAWYRTTFEVPQWSTPHRVLLRFRAVDYLSQVFVNGRAAGEHEGGYTPFIMDVTDIVRPGANSLLVRVFDPPMQKEGEAPRGPYPYNEIPHGKQNWYVQTGGMWQGVDLEFRPAKFIQDVHITPGLDGHVAVDVKANGPAATISVKLFGPAGGLVATAYSFSPLSLTVPSPQLWNVGSPNLYTAEVTLGEDTVRERFGFRELSARDGQFFLNGKPFYMIAALDQDFYPETIYTAPSETYIRDAMLKAQRLGLNVLRCHIKVCQPEYLRAADEVGLLVWYEIPSWADFDHFSPKAADRGEKIFAEMVDRDWNHPSIGIMSVINESWGADLRQADQRQWLRAAFERAKKLTTPRGILVVDNSACCHNFHLKTDINDFHEYNSIPDNFQDWDKRIADFASRPSWTFSPHGDAAPTGKEPLVLSEFGNWGLPELPEKLPWWFDRDFAGREVTRPAGVLQRFQQFGFGRMFPDFNALARATQWHQFASLKYEIEDLRQFQPIRGYVITEFTDINWEVNGLMDMWRHPKVYATALASIQQPDVVFTRTAQRNYFSGQQASLTIFVSHYSDRDLTGARVEWRTATAHGEMPLAQLCTACVSKAQEIAIALPQTDHPQRETVRLELTSPDGNRLAENTAEVFVYPALQPRTGNVALAKSVDSKLRDALAAAGYTVSAGNPGNLLIGDSWTEEVAAHSKAGGRVLLLVSSKDALPATSGLTVTPRADSDYDGNWVTNFNWIDPKSPVFSNLQFGPILGWEAASVTPQFVMLGVKPEQYGADVFAGIFYGWLNNNAALALRIPAMNTVATTFRFDDYGKDPYATYLLDNLIREAQGR